MEITNALYFPNRREWRRWLAQNHDKETEAWVLRYKKNSGKPSVSYEEALEEALCFGWIDGRMRGVDSEKSAVRFSPRKAKSRWSKVNKDKAEKLIEQGKMVPAGLAKIEEAKKGSNWDNAYSTRMIEGIPPDLEEALSANQEAWKNFQRFATGYRNTYIYWVNDAKTSETRKRRIAEVVARSAINKKPGIE